MLNITKITKTANTFKKKALIKKDFNLFILFKDLYLTIKNRIDVYKPGGTKLRIATLIAIKELASIKKPHISCEICLANK